MGLFDYSKNDIDHGTIAGNHRAHVGPRESIGNRFRIAQDGTVVTDEQLEFQKKLREDIAEVAHDLNTTVEDSREKSLALTHLEEALMWAGKAIFK